MGSEDAACNRLTELALNDVSMAGSILAEAVSSSAFAVEAVASPEAHEAFQKVCACACVSCAASASLTAYSWDFTLAERDCPLHQGRLVGRVGW